MGSEMCIRDSPFELPQPGPASAVRVSSIQFSQLTRGVLAMHQFLLSWKTNKHYDEKPTNSPAQGQPNPRKNRSKVAFLGHFFPQHIIFPIKPIISTTRTPAQTGSAASLGVFASLGVLHRPRCPNKMSLGASSRGV